MATHTIPIATFPGGVAPADFKEFLQRVKDDPGMIAQVVAPELRYSAYVAPQAVDVFFDIALTAPEQAIVDGLAAAAPGATAASTSGWLSQIEASAYGGYFEDLGTPTTTAGAPAIRHNHSPSLAGGRYLITWGSEVDGTTGSTVGTARFVLDRGGANQRIDALDSYDGIQKFGGELSVVLPAGPVAMELEIEKIAGGGSARMSYSHIRYSWRGTS